MARCIRLLSIPALAIGFWFLGRGVPVAFVASGLRWFVYIDAIDILVRISHVQASHQA